MVSDHIITTWCEVLGKYSAGTIAAEIHAMVKDLGRFR